MSNRSDETKNRVMTSRERNNFRQTKAWRDFRAKMKKLCNGMDFLTNKKLSKTFNLHHKDQRKENYRNLKEDRFVCLNKESHDCIHFLYRYWIKDPSILDRVEELLNDMKEMSND